MKIHKITHEMKNKSLVLTETQNCQPEPNPEMKNTLKLPLCHLIIIGTAQLL